MSSQHDLLRPLSRPHVALHDLQHACDVKVVAGGAVNDISVEGVAVTSHGVVPGDIFVALNGLKTHGARYAPDAIERGAAAILTDQAGVEVLSALGVLDTGIPVLVSSHNESLRRTMAECAAYIYSRPAQHLQIAGITGTNGKTTTAFFLDAIHRAAHKSTALLGTIEMRLGEVSVPSERTTVEAPVLQGFFSRCLEEKAMTVTMEVSSHAISLDRITETTFEAVGFTNLQQDHLDFHHTMEEYFAAKAALFTPTYARSGVVVVDDQWGRKLVETASIPVESIMTSLSDDSTYNADWTVTETSVSPQGLGVDFVLRHRSGTTVSSHSPLLGDVNVSNAALATVLALRMGIDEKTIVEGLTTLAAVPGRMEVVSQPDEPLVIVDYAHTAEALDFALASLRNTHHATDQGKLIAVFGAAGDRDATKRPLMGIAAMQYADVLIVTDDDPYSEDPEAIRAQIIEGIEQTPAYAQLSEEERSARIKNIGLREDAIKYAIQEAHQGDTVLLAGRGHETIQEIAGVRHVLDDRVEARAVLAHIRQTSGNM